MRSARTIQTIFAHLGVNAFTPMAYLQANMRAHSMKTRKMSQTMAVFAVLGTRSLVHHGTVRVRVVQIFAAVLTGVKFHGVTSHLRASLLTHPTFSAMTRICTTVMKAAEVRTVITIQTVQGVLMIQITLAPTQIALAFTKATPFPKTLSAGVLMQLGIPWLGYMAQVALHGINWQAPHITSIATPRLSCAVAVGAKQVGVM